MKRLSDLTSRYLARLHQGAKASTHQNAKNLRHRQTKAEERLWSLLRNRQLKGKKFRRQHAIANYIVDFYYNESKLAIELDGNLHATAEGREYDDSRTLVLNEVGVTVLRFWNEEVMNDIMRVLKKIEENLH